MKSKKTIVQTLKETTERARKQKANFFIKDIADYAFPLMEQEAKNGSDRMDMKFPQEIIDKTVQIYLKYWGNGCQELEKHKESNFHNKLTFAFKMIYPDLEIYCRQLLTDYKSVSFRWATWSEI